MLYLSKHFNLADMFFYTEEQVMKVYIFKDVLLEGNTCEEALERGIKLIEGGYGSCEWLIDFNRNLSININDNYYRNLPTYGFTIYNPKSSARKSPDEYAFYLLITNIADEHSEVEIITNYTVKSNSYSSAIEKCRLWIERKYRHFNQLEWHIRENMQICVL